MGSMHKTFFIKVYFEYVMSQNGQYLLVVCLDCYKWCRSYTLDSILAWMEGGWNQKLWCKSEGIKKELSEIYGLDRSG